MIISIFIALAIKATEVYVCGYDDYGNYECKLISEPESPTPNIVYEELDHRSTHIVHSK